MASQPEEQLVKLQEKIENELLDFTDDDESAVDTRVKVVGTYRPLETARLSIHSIPSRHVSQHSVLVGA